MLILIISLMPSAVFAQDDGYGHMNGGWHMMNYGYGGVIMWLILIIVIGLLVFLAIQLPKGSGSEKRTQETTLDVLKKRYAGGEINKEEFERMKRDLQN